MLEWLLLHTAAVLALALLALALGRWLRAPAVRHALWLVVLAKLLTPPLLSWPWAVPLPPLPRPAGPGPAAEARPMPAPAPEVGPITDVPLSLPPEGEPGGAAVPAAPRPPAAPARWREWLPAAALWAWLAGALVVAGRQLRGAARVLRLVAEARPAPPWLEGQVRQLAGALGVRPPRVVTLPGLASPLVWGLGRPRLVWPEGLEGRLPDGGLPAVLVHELAHLRRRDHWVGWALLAGACVWWWHPLFRLARRRLGREAELACDAWVVAALPEARRAYAEALIEVCQGRPREAAAPALGAAGSARDLERRLLMVMRGEGPCRLSRRVLLGVGVLALLALPAWTLGQQTKPPAKPGEQKPAQQGQGVFVDLDTDGLIDLLVVDPNQVGDRDKKLQQVEEKLKALLKEVQALRGGDRINVIVPSKVVADQTYLNQVHKTYVNQLHTVKPAKAPPAPGEVHLTRTTYALPAAKAEALAKFLQQHVKAAVLETKAEGDSLTVTTTPEVQRALGGFVTLVQGKQAAKTGAQAPNQPAGKYFIDYMNTTNQPNTPRPR
jgi:beta-lactamase regulating signal transducer with metallopeptidase domain